MVKRQAENLLEEVAAESSPVSKKARVNEPPEVRGYTNGFSSVSSYPEVGSGREESGYKHTQKAQLYVDSQGDEVIDEEESPADGSGALGEDSAYSATLRQQAPADGFSDLYLDTINRAVLDFDFEKLCSVSLSNVNVYACLVCGKYFQGRGPKSHAYYHALEVGHHVYVNMQTKKVYVLPEGYEVKSKSLDDIKFVVDPQLSRDEVARLDKEAKDAWDLEGKKYRPGMKKPWISNG